MKYTISIDGRDLEVETEDGEVMAGNRGQSVDLIRTGGQEYHYLAENGKGYLIRVIRLNREEKKLELEINGKRGTISIQDENDMLLTRLGMKVASAATAANLKAPMPGLVVDVLVKPGQVVSKGDALVILEAMKMENVLKAAGNAVIEKVEIKKGNTVEKNQLLLVFENR